MSERLQLEWDLLATPNLVKHDVTPKRPRTEVREAVDLYPYYAGYSFQWAKAELRPYMSSTRLVLDPWNGSGTTTVAARSLGVSAVGTDLNPAVAIVARARLADRRALPSSPGMPEGRLVKDSTEPLERWFTRDSSRILRQWASYASSLPADQSAVLTVAIFRAIRHFTRSFEGTNPTWVRRPKSPSERVDPSEIVISDEIRREYEQLVDMIPPTSSDPSVRVLTSNASSLPLDDASVDLIIGSPPYLTRIDYAVALSRELAAIGVDLAEGSFRLDFMGTTAIRPGANPLQPGLVPVIDAVTNAIGNHESKDSGGYYSKQAMQYFTDLYAACSELTRVARPNAKAILVLQDSFYKEVPIRLGEICTETLRSFGWCVGSNEVRAVPRLISTMNSSSRTYAKGKVQETVIRMERV